MSGHAIAYHCPYCGEEDLWPHEPAGDAPAHGAWECRSCLSAFSLRSLGRLRPPASVEAARAAARESQHDAQAGPR